MMALTNYPLDEFFSYVHNSKKYRTKLEISINNGLWEYAAVLVWKNTVLFIYEKLFQKKILGNALPDDFNGQLTNGNITVHNCFDFCCISDKNIYTNLHQIWQNVEANYKNVFQGLLDKRNGLSHVNRYEEIFNEQWFKAYFEEALNLIKYFQGLNNIQLSQSIYTSITSGTSIQYISEKDINYLFSKDQFDDSIIINHLLDFVSISDYSDALKSKIKDDAIDNYLNSSSFTNALINGKKLIKLTDCFNETDIRKILLGIQNRQETPNQIIGSYEMEIVILNLFENTVNIEGLGHEWGAIIKKLIEHNEQKYRKVKERFLEVYGEECTDDAEIYQV